MGPGFLSRVSSSFLLSKRSLECHLKRRGVTREDLEDPTRITSTEFHRSYQSSESLLSVPPLLHSNRGLSPFETQG